MGATLTKLGEVGPGGSVAIDRRLGLLRFRQPDQDSVIDVFGKRVGTLPVDQLPQSATFAEVVDVPADEDWSYDFFLLELGATRALKLDSKLIAQINAGQYYCLPLTEAGKYVFRTTAAGVMVVLLATTRGKRRLLISTGPRLARDLDEQESVVGVLDILGYRSLLMSANLKSLQTRLERLLGFVDSTTRIVDSSLLMVGETLDLNSLAEAVKISIVSDTIVVNGTSRVACESLAAVCRACSVIIDFGLFEGWLIRGAITAGEFVTLERRSVFLGRGLVAAHDLEHQQQWMGCAVAKEIKCRWPKVVKSMCDAGFLIRYPCPLKRQDDPVKESLALNWMAYRAIVGHDRRAQLEAALKNAPDAGSREKIENALKFLSVVQDKGRESFADLSFELVPLKPLRQRRRRS